MIFLIFIILAFTWFIIQYFEKRRNARNEEQHERRKEAFTNLLNSLKSKEEKTDNKNGS
ncbi:MAG: hypothetical protein JNK27_10905 [Chitinophagaceae bacterium]|nr:hypothetical protein [Chitinophagaceae bacterium]